jgi:signal transduction histidine kinase
MPEMDGFQVLQELKKIEMDSYVPVLVLTAQPAHKLRALEAGAKDFISKPFDLLEVKTRIHNMLEVRLLYQKLGNYSKELEITVGERTGELMRANEQLSKEIEQRKDTEASLRKVYGENSLLKDQLQAENLTLHKNIDFQEQLVNDLSHQLRTPLAAMRGAIEISMHKARSVPEYQSILESNIAEIDRITALVNTMLSFAKLDGQIERLQYKICDLLKLLEETVGELGPLWEEKSIHFVYRLFRNKEVEEFSTSGAGIPGPLESAFGQFTIEADGFLLKQAIINILDNAYKHTSAGGQITVELYRDIPDNPGFCRTVIMNTGPSIPETTLPHLFTPFFQGDSSLLPSGAKGFGLGLSICRRIVEMHQGKIRAFNPESGGAAFEIILPVTRLKVFCQL